MGIEASCSRTYRRCPGPAKVCFHACPENDWTMPVSVAIFAAQIPLVGMEGFTLPDTPLQAVSARLKSG